MNHFKLLKQLCEMPGLSGFEDEVRALVARELKPFVHDLRVDAMGNLVARKRGRTSAALKVMISAHMDELGFLVTHIDDHGFLRLDRSGGVDIASMPGRPVTICGAKKLNAVIGARALSPLGDDRKSKPAGPDELFVDTGLPARAVKRHVEVGTPVVMRQECVEIGGLVCGKAMDDRVGVFCMIEAARALARTEFDVYFVGSSQEEVGLRGAGPGAFGITPDIGIALDVTRSMDVPGVAAQNHVAALGRGVAIKIKDSGSLAHPGLVRCFRELATKKKIRHQLEVLPLGATDAAAIQRTGAGIPAITLSIPTRYVHSTVETCHPDDIEAAIRLLTAFLETGHAWAASLRTGTSAPV